MQCTEGYSGDDRAAQSTVGAMSRGCGGENSGGLTIRSSTVGYAQIFLRQSPRSSRTGRGSNGLRWACLSASPPAPSLGIHTRTFVSLCTRVRTGGANRFGRAYTCHRTITIGACRVASERLSPTRSPRPALPSRTRRTY